MKANYCIIQTEHQGAAPSDPAVIPATALRQGYNLTEVFGNESPALLERDFDGSELRFFFGGTGYAIDADGDTYATDFHADEKHPEGTRLLLSLVEELF